MVHCPYMGQSARKHEVVVDLNPPRRRVARIRGHRAGVLVGHDERNVTVDYAGNPHGPLIARSTVTIDRLIPAPTAAAPREVLLVFEDERSDRPVIVGVFERVPSGDTPATEGSASRKAPAIETVVDGRRVVIDAEDEIVLQCGEASVTLRRNGRVVIRGAYVETRSRGVNRVKGGTVQIN
jgi:hypothetical protein